MKKIKQIFLLLTVSIMSFTCADHVDYEPIEGYAITADVYFQSESDYDAALIGTYDRITMDLFKFTYWRYRF